MIFYDCMTMSGNISDFILKKQAPFVTFVCPPNIVHTRLFTALCSQSVLLHLFIVRNVFSICSSFKSSSLIFTWHNTNVCSIAISEARTMACLSVSAITRRTCNYHKLTINKTNNVIFNVCKLYDMFL